LVNILLGVTGSVAAIKIREVVAALQEIGEVKIVATDSAIKIIDQIQGASFRLAGKLSWNQLSWNQGSLRILTDEQEWTWQKIGDPVLHIDLKDWADVFVIAPLSANTLAKMANGICDNLLTCIYRAWPVPKLPATVDVPIRLDKFPQSRGGKLLVLAPAMNTDMWESPHTERAFKPLWEIHGNKFRVVKPVEKKLACGTTGIGAMADPADIAKKVREALDDVG